MNFFDTYTSNSIAAGANQFCFDMPSDERRTARAYFKIAYGGEYSYSLLFSGLLDGDYRGQSYANLPVHGWHIHEARVGRTHAIPTVGDLSAIAPDTDFSTEWLADLTFDGGSRNKTAPADLFFTDPVRLSFAAGEYLCIELTFSGERLPCHPESLLPIYVRTAHGWKYSVEMPLPTMIGCDRPVTERVAYLGDSITQGIGAGYNSYLHWNARLSAMIGGSRAFWNLGIGYGTAASAATDGIWLAKAKKNDTVLLCYGVNDINRFRIAEDVTSDLSRIIDLLKAEGCRIILQTVPPFNYPPEKKAVWQRVNTVIKADLARRVDAVFDCVPLLSASPDTPEVAKYGGHPDAAGCAVWAEELYRAIAHLFP